MKENKNYSLLIVSSSLLAFALFFLQTVQVAAYSPMTVGSRGAQVTELQQNLISLGYYNGPVTGYFGPLTKRAVIKFQSMNNVPATGYFGPISIGKLNEINLGLRTDKRVPNISNLSTTSGAVGSNVTIVGTGFAASGNKVKFGDLGTQDNPEYSLNSYDGKTIVFMVPSSNYMSCWYSDPSCGAPAFMTEPGVYKISVINANGTSNEVSFTVSATVNIQQAPNISNLSTSSGVVGSSAAIFGTGFTASGNKVKFGDLGTQDNPEYSLNSYDGKTIVFMVPSSNYMSCWYSDPSCGAPAFMTEPGVYKISVINANGTSNEVSFTVYAY